MGALTQKTWDVKYTPDILSVLGGDLLLRVRGYNLLEYLTRDVEVLERRSRLFHDTLTVPGMSEIMEQTLETLERIAQMVQMQSRVSEGDRDLYSIKELNLYFEVIDRLSAFYLASEAKLSSEDYKAWLSRAYAISAREEYGAIKRGTAALIDKISRVKSISVGFNVDAALSVSESGILSVNDKPIQSGQLIDRLLRSASEEFSLLTMAPLVAPKRVCNEKEYEVLNYSLYQALNKIFKREIRQWEPEMDKYLKTNLDFLLDALPDLQFIMGVTRILTHMQKSGLKLCKPTYRPERERCFSATNFYNPTLALSMAEKGIRGGIVKNTLAFDGEGSLFLLTGANSGGKTVYMRAVGLIQLMAQLGMPVPADQLAVSPASGIFVQLPLYSNRDSRLAEECEKVRAIFSEADGYALCIFDELFSSTDPAESIALSEEVLKAMCHTGIRGIYSTHFHSLTDRVDAIHGEVGECRSKIDFLVAEVDEETERRTYRITRRPPDRRSYAKTISDQYGISYRHLI